MKDTHNNSDHLIDTIDAALDMAIPGLEPIKISITNTTYYVNKKANTVGCHISFNIKGPDNAINIISLLFDHDCYEVTAEAHLNPDDNFDFEIGKKVARAKAESMAYKRVSRMLVRIAYKMNEAIMSFGEFIDKAERVINHNDKYLAKF